MVHLIVLAGGFGTRLRSAVSDVPKPLAPVSGEPFLHYLIENWIRQGVGEFTFLLHYAVEQIENFLEQKKNQLPSSCKIHTVVEETPLGTAGAVAHAVRVMNITGDFFVANADTWLATGIRELERVVAPAIATVNVSDTGRYGAVVESDGLVRAFREKSESSGPGDINAGLYRLSADQFAGEEIKVGSFEVDVFPALVSQGALRTTHLKTDFIDIGIPADYFRFCEWIESGKASAL